MKILSQTIFIVIALLGFSCLREIDIKETRNAKKINPYNYLLIGRCLYADSANQAKVQFSIYDLNSKPVKNGQELKWYNIYSVEQGFSAKLVAVDGSSEYGFRPSFANGKGSYQLSFEPADSVYYVILKLGNKEYEPVRVEILNSASRNSILPVKKQGEIQDYIISFKTTEDSLAVFKDISSQVGYISSHYYDPVTHPLNDTKYYTFYKKGEQEISLREYIGFDNPSWGNSNNFSFNEVATDFYLSRRSFLYVVDQATLERSMKLKRFSDNSINPFRVSESFKAQRVRDDVIIEFYSYQQLY